MQKTVFTGDCKFVFRKSNSQFVFILFRQLLVKL